MATANLVCIMMDNRYVVQDNQSGIQISTKLKLTRFPILISLPVFISTGVYILIAAGALMMVVGFLGCCGAIKESPCMLGLVSGSRQKVKVVSMYGLRPGGVSSRLVLTFL